MTLIRPNQLALGLLGLTLLPAVTGSAQTYQPAGGSPAPTGIGGLFPRKPPQNPQALVMPAGTTFWVTLPKPFRLASAVKGQKIEVDVLTVNPRKQTSSLPIRSNANPGLPPGCALRGEVLDLRQTKDRKGRTQRTAVVIFNELIEPTGKSQPFLGAMSNSEDDLLPGWLQDRKYALKDKASAAESMSVVLPWAADLGPIGIGLAVMASRFYFARKMQREEHQLAALAAVSFIDGDLEPQRNQKGDLEDPAFFVISTFQFEY